MSDKRYSVRLEHYEFDSIRREGCSPVFSEYFECTERELLAMQLFAHGRRQLDSYSSRVDSAKTLAWLEAKVESYAEWMTDDCGEPVDPAQYMKGLERRDSLEAFFENVEFALPEEFQFYDNTNQTHNTFQRGGVVDVFAKPLKAGEAEAVKANQAPPKQKRFVVLDRGVEVADILLFPERSLLELIGQIEALGLTKDAMVFREFMKKAKEFMAEEA